MPCLVVATIVQSGPDFRWLTIQQWLLESADLYPIKYLICTLNWAPFFCAHSNGWITKISPEWTNLVGYFENRLVSLKWTVAKNLCHRYGLRVGLRIYIFYNDNPYYKGRENIWLHQLHLGIGPGLTWLLLMPKFFINRSLACLPVDF